MTDLKTLLFIPYLILIAGVVITIWMYLSRTFNKYKQQIIIMMKNGTYWEWVKDNWLIWVLAKILNYAAVFCFAGFILLSITKVSFDVTILFKLFFPLELISTILHLVLYRKLPVNESEVV